MASELKQSTHGNLPVELTSFVGRDRELTEVRRLLSSARAITLTRPSGIGKSRLALRAAHKLWRHFPNGVWTVELAELVEEHISRRPPARVEANSVPGARPVAVSCTGSGTWGSVGSMQDRHITEGPARRRGLGAAVGSGR